MAVMGFIPQAETGRDNQIVRQDYRHAICFGDTGSGKTATFIMPNLKDRINQGNAIVFMDHKGHEHQKIKHFAMEAGRLDDVVEIGKPHTAYINFMDTFDSDTLQSAIVTMLAKDDKNDYWGGSAAKLIVRCVEIHRKYYEITKTLIDLFKIDADMLEVIMKKDKSDNRIVLKVDEEPSFATLSKILSTPASLKSFFETMQELSDRFDREISGLYLEIQKDHKKKQQLVHLMVKQLHFSDLIEAYGNFSIEEESSEGSGNNGVLQVLNNAITTIATLPSMNHAEVNIMELIKNKAILIIDTQSISTDLYCILLESLLKNLAGRIKHEEPNPVSIFIDEANRVLPPKIDLSNDVLREAKAELILSAQNEHQMIVKFEEEQWKAISENILHDYFVDNTHQLFFNDSFVSNAEPVLLTEETLRDAEYQYNALVKNRLRITQRFIFNNPLPSHFLIHYNIHHFAHKGELFLIDAEQNKEKLLFAGEKNKKRLSSKIHDLNVTIIMKKEDEREQLALDLYEKELDDKMEEDFDKLIASIEL